MIIDLIFLFVMGTVIGSFLNVVVYRGEHTEGNKRTRSYCPKCGHTLGVVDLVPLVSYLFLRGKCRYCQKTISPTYFIGELVVGVLFVLAGYFSGDMVDLTYFLVVVSTLAALFFTDLYYGILPNRLIIIGTISTIAYLSFLSYLFGPSVWVDHILSSLGAFGFFFALLLFSNGRAMGAGDVKYSFWMGLMLGWPNILVGLFIAFLTGAIASVILILARTKKFGQTIPFGPFLVFGTITSLFWGQQILNWYLGIAAQ